MTYPVAAATVLVAPALAASVAGRSTADRPPIAPPASLTEPDFGMGDDELVPLDDADVVEDVQTVPMMELDEPIETIDLAVVDDVESVDLVEDVVEEIVEDIPDAVEAAGVDAVASDLPEISDAEIDALFDEPETKPISAPPTAASDEEIDIDALLADDEPAAAEKPASDVAEAVDLAMFDDDSVEIVEVAEEAEPMAEVDAVEAIDEIEAVEAIEEIELADEVAAEPVEELLAEEIVESLDDAEIVDIEEPDVTPTAPLAAPIAQLAAPVAGFAAPVAKAMPVAGMPTAKQVAGVPVAGVPLATVPVAGAVFAAPVASPVGGSPMAAPIAMPTPSNPVAPPTPASSSPIDDDYLESLFQKALHEDSRHDLGEPFSEISGVEAIVPAVDDAEIAPVDDTGEIVADDVEAVDLVAEVADADEIVAVDDVIEMTDALEPMAADDDPDLAALFDGAALDSTAALDMGQVAEVEEIVEPVAEEDSVAPLAQSPTEQIAELEAIEEIEPLAEIDDEDDVVEEIIVEEAAEPVAEADIDLADLFKDDISAPSELEAGFSFEDEPPSKNR